MALPEVTVEQITTRYPELTTGVEDETVEQIIVTASNLIAHTILAPYNENYVPHNDAAETAIIEQTAAWLNAGETHDLAGYTEAVKVGDVTIPAPNTVAPRALRALRFAGLLTPYGA